MTDEGSSPSRSLAPGKKLDRFELLARVAQGGMADVWLARLPCRHGVAKRFAVKTILPHLAVDGRFHTMFVNEARIASRIEHPNVAQIFELGEHDGAPYMVMEWVDGDSIEALMDAVGTADPASHGRIPVAIAAVIVADACAGLHAAHELTARNEAQGSDVPLGVVHRDVSPQNLLVTRYGTTKLIDFGVAKAKDRLGAQTSAGSTRGKICFMPREQALGEAIDRRADVWALGAVLHFMLAGEHPFMGDTALDTLRRVMAGELPRRLPDCVPPSIADVARRALSHDVDERFESAMAMRAALLEAAEALELDTRHESVAAFVGPLLAHRRTARDEMIARALDAIDAAPSPRAETLSPVATTAAAVAKDAYVPPLPAREAPSETPRLSGGRIAVVGAVLVALFAAIALVRPRLTYKSHADAAVGPDPSAELPLAATSTLGAPAAYADRPAPAGPASAGAAPDTTATTPASAAAIPSSLASPRPAVRPKARATGLTAPRTNAPASASPTMVPPPSPSLPPRRDYGF